MVSEFWSSNIYGSQNGLTWWSNFRLFFQTAIVKRLRGECLRISHNCNCINYFQPNDTENVSEWHLTLTGGPKFFLLANDIFQIESFLNSEMAVFYRINGIFFGLKELIHMKFIYCPIRNTISVWIFADTLPLSYCLNQHTV